MFRCPVRRWQLDILRCFLAAGALGGVVVASHALAADTAADKAPLGVELVPAQVVLERGQPSYVFLILDNAGAHSLQDLQVAVHVPVELRTVTATWEGGGTPIRNDLQVTVPSRSQALVKLRLVSSDAWSAVKSGTMIVSASYSWRTTDGSARAGHAARAFTVKVGTLETLQVLGVPVALAIFVVPGMLGIMLFEAALRNPPKWLNDNRLFVSFLASAAMILGWNHVRGWFDGPDLWSGVSVEVLLAFTAGAGVIGWIAGSIAGRFQRTAAEIWPVRSGLPLWTILVHLARRQALPTTWSTVKFKDGTVLSALAVESDAADEILLLPRRYRVTVKDETLKQRFRDAVSGKAIGYEFAELLEMEPTVLGVADGIKRQTNGGVLIEEQDGEQPISRPRSTVQSRTSEQPTPPQIFVVSP